MANKDVLKISFDANAGIQELERNLLGSMDQISDEVSDKLEQAFKKAGRNPKLKKQLTGVYQGLFDELSVASGDLDKVNDAIDRFTGKIKYLNDVINTTSKNGKVKNQGLLDNLSIENIDKVLKDYDKYIEKQNKIDEYNDKKFRDKKRSETTIKSLKELERTYGDVGEAKGKYEQKVKDYLKNANIETSTISKEIKEYSSLIALFDKINNTKVDKGSNEAIKKSQSLLYVMQKISDLENGNKLFENFRINELDIEGITTSLTTLTQQVEASITNLIGKITKDLNKQIEEMFKKAVLEAEKASQKQFKAAQKVQAKIPNKNNQGLGTKADSNVDNNNSTDFVEKPDGVDVWTKSAQELEDEFKDVIKYATDVETSLKRINEIWDKYANGKGTLYKGEIEEMFTLMKRLDSLEQNGAIDKSPLNKDQLEEFNEVLFEDQYEKVFERIDELTDRQLKKIEELKTAQKDVFSEGKTDGSVKIDDSKVEELKKEITEVKEDISSLKGRVDTLEDTTAFDNLSSQVAGFDEKIKKVDGSIENLVNSFKLLSELSLTDLQKVAIPFFNGINQVYKEKDGNQISGYWDTLKKEIEDSNVELKELLKLVGLYDSKTDSINLIGTGNKNSGGLIGDNKVLISRKKNLASYEDTLKLKDKLDEAYKAGINVSRILDVIGTKESDVFLEIQERNHSSILGNINNANKMDDWINPELFESTDEQLKKLIEDAIKLNKLGFGLDLHESNILFDKEKGFSIIDLDLDPAKYENYNEFIDEIIGGLVGAYEIYYDETEKLSSQEKADGQNLVEQFRKRFTDLAETMQQAYAEAQDSHSPSKEFEKLENDAVDGIVEGANKNEGRLKNVGKQMADSVKDGFKEGISEINGATLPSDVTPATESQQKLQEEVEETIIDYKEIDKTLGKSFETKGAQEAYTQLKKYADEFKKVLDNKEHYTSAGEEAAYNYFRAFQEAIDKKVSEKRLHRMDLFKSDHTQKPYLFDTYNWGADYPVQATYKLDSELSIYAEKLLEVKKVTEEIQNQYKNIDLTKNYGFLAEDDLFDTPIELIRQYADAIIKLREAQSDPDYGTGVLDTPIDELKSDVETKLSEIHELIRDNLEQITLEKNHAERDLFKSYTQGIDLEAYDGRDHVRLFDLQYELLEKVSDGTMTNAEAQAAYNEELSKTLTYEQKYEQEYESKRGQARALSGADAVEKAQEQIQEELKETQKQAEKTYKVAIDAFRGVNVANVNKNGYWSSLLEEADYFAKEIGDGNYALKKGTIGFDNPYTVDLLGRDNNFVPWIGNGTDEASKDLHRLQGEFENVFYQIDKILKDNNIDSSLIHLSNGFDDLFDVFSYAGIDENKFELIKSECSDLLKYFYDIRLQMDSIFSDDTNPYFIGLTDKVRDAVTKSGMYDGVIYNNIKDGADGLSNHYAPISEKQIKFTEIISGNLDNVINKSIEANDRIEELNDLRVNQTPLLSPNLTDTSISETKEEVKELNQEVDNIGNNFKEEESQVSSFVSNEISMLQNLDQKLGEVTTAVDTKTRAFQEEEQVVVGTVQREISSLEALEGQIWSIINELKRFDDIKIQINIDSSQIDDSFVTLLDNIRTKVDGLPIDTLSNLATALQGLKVTSKTAENLELVAVALSEFKDSLSGISVEGNEFLKLIGDITSRSSELKDLAEVLKSTTKKIKEANEATREAEDKGKDEGSKDATKGKKTDPQKNLAAINETNAAMEKLKHLSDSEIFSDAFEKATKEIEEENLKLKTTNGYLTEYKKKVKEIQTELQKQAGVIKFVDPGDLENARAVIGAYAREISEYQAKLKSISTSNDGRKEKITYEWIEKETGLVRNLTLTYDKLTGAIYENSKAHQQAEKSGFKFSEMLKQGWMNVVRYVSSFVGFYEVWNAIRNGVTVIRELDTAFTEMRKVSDESVESLKNFQKASFDIADTVGTTAAQIQNSTADFMRLGESLEQAAKSAEVANILLNVSEFENIDEATKSLVSMAAAYDELDKIDIVDKLNIIGNNFAISTDGLATALQNSASALKTANNDMDEAVALATAANAVVQDPDKVGAGLRTIALRITGTEAAKAELEELGESVDDFTVTTASKLNEQVMMLTKTTKEAGVSLLDMNGNYRSTYEIISDIADRWEDIKEEDLKTGENRQNALLEMLAGKNRSNILASMLESPDVLKEAYKTSVNDSAGSAQEELDKYLDSIEGKIQKFQNNLQEFWYNLLDSDMVKQVVDAGTKLISILGNITSGIDDSGILKGVTSFLSTIIDLIDKLTSGLGNLSTVLAGVLGVGLYKKIKGKDSGGRVKQKSTLIKYATEQVNREVSEL